MTMKTIAIDFDGVIHQYSKGYADGTAYDFPVDGAFNAIKQLMKWGFAVYIFSTRNEQQIQDWFAIHHFGVTTQIIQDQVFWETPDVLGISKRKIPAIAYIDDRGIRFTNWKDILNYF